MTCLVRKRERKKRRKSEKIMHRIEIHFSRGKNPPLFSSKCLHFVGNKKKSQFQRLAIYVLINETYRTQQLSWSVFRAENQMQRVAIGDK